MHTVTVMARIFVLFEEGHLAAVFPRRFRTGFHVLPDHGVTARPGPFFIGVLKAEFARFQAFLDAAPFTEPAIRRCMGAVTGTAIMYESPLFSRYSINAAR
jgi:hypothetical protein